MYDADVSVQQSVRASSPSRACVDGGCGCGCNYDGGIVQEIRRSRRCCRLIKHQAPRKRRNKGWRWRWWWQNSRRKQNSGVDLISSTRAFASSLALVLLRKGTGPAFFRLPEAFVSMDRVRVSLQNGLTPGLMCPYQWIHAPDMNLMHMHRRKRRYDFLHICTN